jgi:hypothetical protein
MHKLVFFPVLLIAGCVIAGAYGAAHNQISYTVSPRFFSCYQFGRFDLPPEMWNRTGATLVGILATWWMGLVIGPPVLLVALVLPGWKAYVKHSLIAFGVAAGTALVIGLAALAAARFLLGRGEIGQAEMMHDFGYAGGGVGVLTAVAYLTVVRVRTGGGGVGVRPSGRDRPGAP